ncbi:MAG: hypothetical protein L6367_04735 [Cellulomonas sp.]|nr:hypothetical protein [Cellulomonas sp.]
MTLHAKLAAALYALWFVALLVVVVRAGRIGRGHVPRTIRFGASGTGIIGVLTVWAMTWTPSASREAVPGASRSLRWRSGEVHRGSESLSAWDL